MSEDVAADCAVEDMWVHPSTGMNQFSYDLQVEGDGSFFPSGDEVIEADNLQADPQTEKALDDDAIYLNLEIAEKCFSMEDFPCTVDYYNQEEDCGVLGADAAQIVKQQPTYEFVDSMLQGVDEERNLHLACSLSSLCPDYFLDSGYSESSLLDYASHNESKNLGSEYQTQSVEKESDVGVDLTNAVNPMANSTADQSTLFLDNMDVHELHNAFRSTFGRDTCVRDKHWLKRRILFGLQNLGEIDDVSGHGESGLTENEDNVILIPRNDLCERVHSIFTDLPDKRTLMIGQGIGRDGHSGEDSNMPTSRVGLLNSGEKETSLVSSKRLRKPTRRYIEETSEMKSRCGNERLKTTVISSRDKIFRIRTDSKYHWKGDMSLVYQECPAVSGINVSHGHHGRSDCPRKNTSLTANDKKEEMPHRVSLKTSFASQHFECESQDHISDEYAAAIGNENNAIRRKHHRQWTLSEVMKLVDGVSQYGVGRWTEIKRLLFSTSAYRTSVDLKDKWRNLLRASQLHNRNQVEPQKKHASVPIPQSVLWRVRELSIIHPYPRERKSRLPSAAAATPMTVHSDDTSISRSGRTVHRRSFT